MSNNTIYRSPTFPINVQYAGGDTKSPLISLRELSDGNGKNRGTAQALRIKFPSNWIFSDVTFEIFESSVLADGGLLYANDTATTNPYLITAAPDSTIPLLPAYFNSIEFFQILSVVPQADNPLLTVITCPIYQMPG